MPLARACSPPPLAWAACTVKPVVRAAHSPPNSQVTLATTPAAAAASAFRWPSMAASMYCMTTEETWAHMDGSESRTTSQNSSRLFVLP